MPLPFDATLKDLVQRHTADFERAFRLPTEPPATVLNVDLSVVSAATDVVLGYGDPPERVVDLNFQAGRNPELPDRELMYNGILRYRYHVPVHSVVVLLRPAADGPELTGEVAYAGVPRRGRVGFRYEVIRLWQRPVRRLLRGGVGALPLAILGQLPPGVELTAGLADVIRQIDRRLARAARPEDANQLMTATLVLTGLRVPNEEARQLFQGVRTMRESSTYMGIITEGRIEEAQKILFRLGRPRLGQPDEGTQASINGLNDLERLERMLDRIHQAASWQDLLATP